MNDGDGCTMLHMYLTTLESGEDGILYLRYMVPQLK